MCRRFLLLCAILFGFIETSSSLSSPLSTYLNYSYSTTIRANAIDLWWSIDRIRDEITFELHVNTTGWLALGISPAGGMKGADIGLGWIDRSGHLHFQDRYAYGTFEPVIDNTTFDWIGLQGREENGWTAIQFKRALDTCDSMDYPIKSGTNILIFAYGEEDPIVSDGKATISYHGHRRYTRILPLQSYSNPPSESKLAGLDFFEFRVVNYSIPAYDTVYYCKVFRVPNNITKPRHVIAYETLLDLSNRDLVHHLLMYECVFHAPFNETYQPEGICSDASHDSGNQWCSKIAIGWAMGGNEIVEYPPTAGYPVGADFEVKYYMIEIHYDNPNRMSNRTDSSGIRFYLGSELRQHDIGFLSLGVFPNPFGIIIPPRMERFNIDSYCPAAVTRAIPQNGITVFSAFPHSHLQGRSIWSKIIRNKTAIQYLFNADAYDFNYQFMNQFPEPIKLYPGDEIATRCVYNTMNKDTITLGGFSTRDEMCLHIFAYYPRVKNLDVFLTAIRQVAWMQFMNMSWEDLNGAAFQKWILSQQWTAESRVRWQRFFNEAPRLIITSDETISNDTYLNHMPSYVDLPDQECRTSISAATHHQTTTLLLLLLLLMLEFLV